MADENVTTNIVVNSNFSSLIGDLNRASAALMNFRDKLSVSNKALAQQVAVINRTFAETMRSTGQFSTHFVSLNSDVEKFGSQLDKGQIKLNQFFRVFNDHTKTSGGIIRQLAQQQVQLQNAIIQPLGRNAEGIMQYNVHIPRGLDLVRNRTALAKQELQILNKVVQEGANQLINWGKNTQWAGRQLTVGLTVPLAAFGKAAADAFAKADAELVRLTKVYGGVAATSSAELKKIRNEVAATAADLAKAYGASFQETIGLAADIAATGKQGNELLNSIRETTRLAVLGEVDRQDAMKATLAIQTAFKQSTKELGESINFLNAVENQTSTTLADLVEAIPKAGPVIKGLGGDVKDLALYLTAMREGGISASEGANALKSGLASLINPTKVAKEQFKSFGIDLTGIVDRNAGNVTNTILELQGALDKLDPLKKQKALEQLFGKFQFARMNALFSNLGKQGSQTLQVLDLMKASSQDLANIAGRELSQVTESASGKYRRALEGLKADLAGVGDQFLKINTALINIVDKVIQFASHLPKPIKQLLGVLGMFTAAAGPLIMLTGVLGNFIGYIVKGIFHLRSLFKGGEGWRLLTPEILAANRAASMVEQTFYSDAKAANVFNQAVQGLTGSLAALETKLYSNILNIAPQMATTIGLNQVVPREVNPQHPLISAVDTRSMSHMNPVAGMSPAEKEAQTMFGVVPGAPKVNQKIGKNPQVYMAGDLARVAGVSSIRGVSTGVVAEEAAKWHAMTAALAMQSKAELAKLKTEIATTGLVTEELSVAYQAVLPKMNELVSNAAAEAAQIVESARVGKISADEARAQIIALNARLEQLMAQTATTTATNLGRTIDVTRVPLTDQPVVDPSGKSNMKELTKPGRTRDLLNKIAGVLGVKTYGAGYSIETTRPKKFNEGNIVPGVGNTDTVPAMLTPGEFVVNKEQTARDPRGLEQYNKGQAVIVPIKRNRGGHVPGVQYFGKINQNRIVKSFERVVGKSPLKIRGATFARFFYDTKTGANLNKQAESMLESHYLGRTPLKPNGTPYTEKELQDIAKNPNSYKDEIKYAWSSVDRGHAVESVSVPGTDQYIAPGVMLIQNRGGAGGNRGINNPNREYSPSDVASSLENANLHPMTILSLAKQELFYGKDREILLRAYNDLIRKLKARKENFLGSDSYEAFAERILKEHLSEITNPNQASVFWKDLISVGTLRGTTAHGKRSLGAVHNISYPATSRMDILTANWPKKQRGWPLAKSYILNNEDPLHGPLMIGKVSGTPGALYYDRGKIYPNTPSSFGFVDQFPIGSPREQALYALKRYMLGIGDPSIMSLPAVKTGLAELSQRWTGTAYRGIRVGESGNVPGLPNHIARAIYDAEKSGNYEALIGKNFFMRSASWSEKSDVAQRFGTSQNASAVGTVLQVALQNRKVVPASKINPEIGFDAAGIWPGTNIENEMLFGGAFRVVSAEPGKIVLATAPGRVEKRERGGNVKSGNPYLVGEKGPELFMPNQSGNIIPHYRLGGIVGKAAGFALPMMAGMFASGQVDKLQIPGIAGMLANIAAWGAGAGAANKIIKIFTPAVVEATAETGKFSSVLGGLNKAGTLIPGWGKVAIVALTAVATASYGAWEKARKARIASQEAIKLDKDKVGQVGITYKSLTDKIKETTAAYIEQSRMLRAKAAGASAIGGGVNLTISQFKDLQKQIKQTSPDIIKMFNEMNKDDVIKNVADLKAQLVSAGKSAQEATNYIYTMMSLTNKKDMTTQVLGSTDFNTIVDQLTAAKYSTKSAGLAFKSGTMDSAELSKTFDQGLVSIDQYFNSIEKIKDSTGKLVIDNQAVSKTIDAIKNSEMGRQQIGEANLNNLIKQKPELAIILNKSDSIADAWVKTKLYTSGIDADLSKISGIDAQNMLRTVESIRTAANIMTKVDTNKTTNPMLYGLAQAYIKSQSAAKSAAAIAKRASDQSQKDLNAEIALIDKKIQSINDEYDARKKLLEYTADKESYQISLKKEQLNYSQAVATGDLEGAAQSQLNLKQLNLQYQKQEALRVLEEKRNKDVEAWEKKKARMQEDAAKAQEKAAKLQAAAAAAQQKANSIAIIQQSIANTLTMAAVTKDQSRLDLYSKSLQSDISALRKLDPQNGALINPLTSNVRRGPNVVAQDDWKLTLDSLINGKDNLLSDAATTFSGGADKFALYVSKLLNLPSASATGKAYGNVGSSGASTVLERKGGKWVDSTGKEYTSTEASNTPQGLPKNSNISPYQHPMYSGKDISSIKNLKDYDDPSTGLRYTANGDVYQKKNNQWYKVGIWYNQTYGTPGSAGSSKNKAYAMGGPIGHYGPGGKIIGSGTKTSDSIPIMASTGEYMLSAKAVDNLGGPANVDYLHKAAKDNSVGSFLHKLLFGTGNLPEGTLKNEIPFGPGNIAKLLYKAPNAAYGLLNYFKARKLMKAGMFHGSAEKGGEYLSGSNLIENAIARDQYYGMGFYSTASKSEADLYASGYNTSTAGSSYGSINKINKIPFGKYIDFRKNLKWQDYALYKAAQKATPKGRIDWRYLGEDLGPNMKRLGLNGAIMDPINAGWRPAGGYGTWLSWANPKGIHTQSLAEGGLVKTAPHDWAMHNQVPAKKLNWFQAGANSILKGFDKLGKSGFNPFVPGGKLGYTLLAEDLVRRTQKAFTGTAGKTDYATLAMSMLPMGGAGKSGIGAASKAFNAADIGVINRYVERPMINAESMAWVLDKAPFGKDAGTFYRALSNHDMAALAGYTRVPNRHLQLGKSWMDNFIDNSPMSSQFKDMTEESRWAGLAGAWKKNAAELIKNTFGSGKEPLYGSEAALPFMDLKPALKIGETWTPNILKSITKELDFAKMIAVKGGTGGGENKAIAKIIVDPSVKGIGDFRNVIPNHEASRFFPNYTEGAIAPFTRYVLQAINKNAHHYTDEAKGVSHLIDEYVLKAVGTAPYGQFLNRQLSRIFEELPIVKKANGGYVGKLHSWNGQVPGPYGKEVTATLKAGTEGVYQTDYINSLKNGTMGGNTYTISPVIYAAPGMDENMVADIASRKVMSMIKSQEFSNRAVGTSKVVGR